MMLLWLAWAAMAAPVSKTPDSWEAVVERSIKGVVAIRVNGTRDFDTEGARASQGTGFIVDLEKGLILTNRHMVHAGPVVAEAILWNHEELDLQPLWRDPVHDFGLYRFDPAKAAGQGLVAIPLDPAGARVGVDIRVMGNDSGEKLSILDGTLSRLDRNAPEYGPNTYNDFNTFYYQAPSSTSGGSSGSPVLDIRGNAVALNAGGKTRAASSFYLPLDRVVAAIDHLKVGEAVPRGTWQAVFRFEAFSELGRLGLTDETRRQFLSRNAKLEGLLVVREVLKGGPADGLLKVGDILVSVDDKPVADFVTMERLVDASVGKALSVKVERAGKPVELKLPVQDLHAITPDDYLEFGKAVIHDLSFHQARNAKVPVKGAYLASPGYVFANAGVPAGAVLTHLDGVELRDLADLEARLAIRPHGDSVRVRWFPLGDFRRSFEAVIHVDRQWFPMQHCVRDDAKGLWPCVTSPAAPSANPVAPPTSWLPPQKVDGPPKAVAASMVSVSFDIPYPTAGVKDQHYSGVGVIVDKAKGLILLDRDTVPVGLGDLELLFGGTVRVPGVVRWLHPIHNFALVQYDPARLGGMPVEEIRFAKASPEEGDTVWQVGLNRQGELVSDKTEIRERSPLGSGIDRIPRYRDVNVEVLDLSTALANVGGGVLVDKSGAVVALWASFVTKFYGLPIEVLREPIEAVRRGEDPVYQWLGAEMRTLTPAVARERGISDERLVALFGKRRVKGQRVLEVSRRMAGSPADQALADSDLVVAIDGAPVTRMSDLELGADRGPVKLTVVRDAKELEVTVTPVALTGHGVERVVSFAGLLLHEPHLEVAKDRGVSRDGVYIAWMWAGAPAAAEEVYPTRKILAVNEVLTPTLDTFLEVVSGLPDRSAVRLQMQSLDDSSEVKTLKLDLNYWPTEVLERRGDSWDRKVVGGGAR